MRPVKSPKKAGRLLVLLALALVMTIVGLVIVSIAWEVKIKPRPVNFDGARALEDVYYQVGLGSRIPGSIAHQQAVTWMEAQLRRAGWSVEVQQANSLGYQVKNVIGRWHNDPSSGDWIILGAHYDSRLAADRDPDPAKRLTPVPGANDGASGVAVLLELARRIPPRLAHSPTAKIGQVWLVFFDAEDNGRLPGWDWVLGSREFVARLEGQPDAVIILDMIGDADLTIYQEGNSDPALTQSIWSVAERLGYQSQFISQVRYTLLDDHTAFLNAGIAAIDVIDFDYPYWHTTADTPDKVSIQSLQIVGDTILAWLDEYK